MLFMTYFVFLMHNVCISMQNNAKYNFLYFRDLSVFELNIVLSFETF